MTFTVKHDLDKLNKKLYGFEKNLAAKAGGQAINRTMATVRSRAVKAISAETSVKQKELRANISIASKASNRTLKATLSAVEAKAKNLIHFVSPAQRNANTFRRRVSKGFKHPGVKAKAWGKSKHYDGTFIGTGRGGNLRVFKRTSGASLPLQAVYGPSPRLTFDSSKIEGVMKRTVAERFRIELSAAINNQIRRQK